MPITPTYPGVYVEEISSGVRTITGVGTSVVAFIDFFTRGPVDKAEQIFSQTDFDRIYGGLHPQSEASYAVQQFFLNGGGEAWVVRCSSGGAGSLDGGGGRAEIAIREGTTGDSVLKLQAASPGDWGKALRARIDRNGGDATFDLTVSEASSEGGGMSRQEVFRGLSMPSDGFQPNEVKAVVDDGSQLVRVLEADKSPKFPEPNGTFSGSLASFTDLSAISDASKPGRRVKVKIDGVEAEANLGKAAISSLEEARDRLQEAIQAARPDKLTFAQATVEIDELPDDPPGTTVLRVLAGPGKPSDRVEFFKVRDDTTAADLKLLTADHAKENVQAYTPDEAISGTGQAAGKAGSSGTPPDAAALQAALKALKDVDFNLLCIPRVAELLVVQANQVIATATAECERKRAFLLVDIPKDVDTVQEIKDWSNTVLRSRNAAVYFPRLKIADPLNGFRLRSVGASGTMAGVHARTDSQRGVWKAPAGLDAMLVGVQELDYVLNDAETGALNPLGINTLRTFPVYGTVAWGARTLRGADAMADEYKYIPIRRLALYLEESLFRGLKWVVFEPNDEPLWAQIRLNVGAFMQNLFRQGAFQGQTRKEAYFVKCDKETTTQNDRNQGIVNVMVGFAPLKPAEFVMLKIQQMAGQIET